MNIERLDLIAYGHLTDVSMNLSATPHRFHVIIGKNESGKSTSMRAIEAWLYGFRGQTSDDYVHVMKKLRVGGVLRNGDQTLHCVRRKGTRGTLLDGSDGKKVIAEEEMLAMLGGVDRETFGTQFLIDHDELVSGGQMILQGQGDLGEMLFAAGAGLGRLKKVQEELKADQDFLFKRQGKSKIGEAIKAIKKYKAEIKEAQVPPAQYEELQNRLADKESELAELKKNNDAVQQQRTRIVAQLDALPTVPRWQQATDQLTEVRDAPVLADDFSERRRDVNASIKVAQNALQRLSSTREKLQSQLEQIVDDSATRQHAEEIEVLFRRLPVREERENERKGELATELRRLDRDMHRQIAELASVTSSSPPIAEGGDDSQLGDGSELTVQAQRYEFNEPQANKVRRLASQHGTLAASVEDAKRQVKKLNKRVLESETKRKQLETLDASDRASRVLNQIESPPHLLRELEKAKISFTNQSARSEQILKKLGIALPIKGAVSVSLPDPEMLERSTKKMSQIAGELENAKRISQDLQRQLAEEQIHYDAQETDMHLPSPSALRDARRARDRQLEKLAQRFSAVGENVLLETTSLDIEQDDFESVDLDELIQWVRQADEIVDQLRFHQNEVAAREAMLVSLRKLTAKSEQARQDVKDLESEQEQAEQGWRSLWDDLGVEPRSPAAMKDWISEHEKLTLEYAKLGESEVALRNSEQAIELAIEQLSQAIGKSPVDNDAPPTKHDDAPRQTTLLKLHDQAVLIAEENEKNSSQRNLLDQQIDAWKSDLEELEWTLSDRELALQKWQAEWDTATESLQAVSIEPDDVVPTLDAIKSLADTKRERDQTTDRIKLIESESIAFMKSVASLLGRIDGKDNEWIDEETRNEELFEQAAQRIHSLHARMKKAVESEEHRLRIEQELQSLANEIEKESQTLIRQASLAEELCVEAGCGEIDELPDVEKRAQQRKEASQAVGEQEAKLKILAAGRPLKEFIESLHEVQADVLESEKEQLTRDHEAIRIRLEETQREAGAIAQQLRQIDGGASASDLNQQLASELGEISSDAQSYIRLKLASGILRRAIEHYRDENQGPVLRMAEDYFHRLTCGDYVGLKVDYDGQDNPILHGVREGRDDVPAFGMSKGTADSLYLSLRLASLVHRCDQGHAMPLIVDDCLQQLDNPRATAAMQVFSEVSIKTQVIMFTHHEHLVELASEHLPETGVHIHSMERRV